MDEWNEQIVYDRYRGIWGGSWFSGAGTLAAALSDFWGVAHEDGGLGFRVARLVPEPGMGLLGMTGVLGLALRRERTAKATARS